MPSDICVPRTLEAYAVLWRRVLLAEIPRLPEGGVTTPLGPAGRTKESPGGDSGAAPCGLDDPRYIDWSFDVIFSNISSSSSIFDETKCVANLSVCISNSSRLDNMTFKKTASISYLHTLDRLFLNTCIKITRARNEGKNAI